MVMNKKGEGLWWTIIGLVIALAVLLIFVAIFFPHLFGFGDAIQSGIKGVDQDADRDGTINFRDDCPCLKGLEEYKGCPKEMTEEEIEIEKKKFNTDTKCGTLVEESDKSFVTKEGEGAFQHYQSIEIYGNDDNGNPKSGLINNACVHWMGLDCPTQEKGCDKNRYNYQFRTDGCWVMANEDDWLNDCGQNLVKHSTIISASSSNSMLSKVIPNTYFSWNNKQNPKNLFSWKWKSKAEYGSLICHRGFWFSCREGGEGKSLEVVGEGYVCENGEWSKK
jgi:hypothetical protein